MADRVPRDHPPMQWETAPTEYTVTCGICAAMVPNGSGQMAQHESWHWAVADAMALIADRFGWTEKTIKAWEAKR